MQNRNVTGWMVGLLMVIWSQQGLGQSSDWLPPIPIGTLEVKLDFHAAGFTGSVQGIDQILPTKLVPIPDGSGRMVVSTLGGLLRIMDADGNLLPVNNGVYLNTNTNETAIAPYAYGVTSVAFHPDFANQGTPGLGKFYVLVTEAPKPSPAGYDFVPVIGAGNDHAAVLVEYAVDANAVDADFLIPSGPNQNVSRRELFIAQEPDNGITFVTWPLTIMAGYTFLQETGCLISMAP